MVDRAADIARRALKKSLADRETFLEGACADDENLLAAVRRAMAALDTEHWAQPAPGAGGGGQEMPTAVVAAQLLNKPGDEPLGPPEPPPRPTTPSRAGEGPGGQIGPYKILQLIGEGGFGYVYMAAQTHPVKRKVALKILKPGMDTRQVIGRFESERQALAMMDHPNIARVFDAGATPTGRPYFVMELVRGVAINEYCDSARLTTRERLDLFVDICHAVQHAHFKGIVHRDLKPGNVLVTLHDDKPVVKVIDFGIAKAMNQELTSQTVFTEFRQFVGTPEYMSPEQAAMSGLDVDYRTDIYSLGVLLYELMSGATPFDSQKLRSAGLAEVQRMIREDEPPRPSTRVSRAAGWTRGGGKAKTPALSEPGGKTAASVEDIAKHRRTDPRTLRRLLAGDLDWIVMKAMEKDRTRRYETTSALADDIRRHINYQPIVARPPSAPYRMRKFARRNRIALGAAGGVFSALLLTLAALAYGLLEVSHERDKTAERETETRAKMLLSSMNAVRTYTADNVRPALAVAGSGNNDANIPDYHAHFVKEMVPGFAAKQVFTNFRDAKRPDGSPGPYSTFVYKEASPNPTNRDNRADPFEAEIVERFIKDRKLTEFSGIREFSAESRARSSPDRVYYIARPMVVNDAKCLDCHTTVETAPSKQVALYGKDGWTGGYGWKMNEVIAAQIVYVPVSEAFKAESTIGIKVLGALAAIFLAGGLVSLLLLTRRA